MKTTQVVFVNHDLSHDYDELAKTGVDVRASLTSNGKRRRELFDNRKTAMTAAKALHQAIDPATGLIRVRAF